MVKRYESLQSTWNLSISLNEISETSFQLKVLNNFQLSSKKLTVK
jgi:hypothetical protein